MAKLLVRHAFKVWQIDNLRKWKAWPEPGNLIHCGRPLWWQYGDEWYQAGKDVSNEFIADSKTTRKLNALPSI